MGDRFIIRIEDIDPERCKPEFADRILETLDWLGLESATKVLKQSTRLLIYQQYLQKLIEESLVYPCVCTRKDIQRALEASHAPNDRYPGTCRNLRIKDLDPCQPFAWRLNISEIAKQIESIQIRECGETELANVIESDDIVVARKDVPTSYHLSSVVDDELQGVTLVTRGIDLRPACLPQRILQECLSFREQHYHHHVLILGSDGRRLAKRHQSPSIRSLRDQGFSATQVLELACESSSRLTQT